MLRAVPDDLVLELRTFARTRGLSLPAGAVELLRRGLQVTAARAKGAAATNRRTYDETRAEAGPCPYCTRTMVTHPGSCGSAETCKFGGFRK